jgi:hypothetical protein
MSTLTNVPAFSIANLKAAAINVCPAFKGQWSTIEFRPDLFVPQAFTIGVIVQADDGSLRFALLENYKKFECVYGENFPKREMSDLMHRAHSTMSKLAQDKADINLIRFDSPNLFTSSPSFTSGSSIEAVLERLYRDIVVMHPTGRDTAGITDDFISTARARELVNTELKRIAGMDYERIIVPQDEQYFLDSTGYMHRIDVGLVTPRGCGSIVSAAYRSQQSIEINLLRASSEVGTFAKLKNLAGRSIFVLGPDHRPNDEVSAFIGEQLWKLENAGFRVSEFPTPAEVARDIYEWASPNL